MQRKYAIAWRIGGALVEEDEFSLLDFFVVSKFPALAGQEGGENIKPYS